MSEGPPLELLQDALARIRDDGELIAVTPAMTRWLAGYEATRLAALPLDDGQRAEFEAGLPVVVSSPRGVVELQRIEHGGQAWLRVAEVADRVRGAAAEHAAARSRSMGRLAGSLVHDLNNQLNAAIGLAAMLAPLVRDQGELESLRSLERAVVHGARLADATARLLRRTPDHRAVADVPAIIDDVTTLVCKALATAGVEHLPAEVAAGLRVRVAHDDAVHAVMVGMLALLDGAPASLRIAAFGRRHAIAGGRQRDVVVLRVAASGLAAEFRDRLRDLCDAAPGVLGIGAGHRALAGLVGMVLAQRRAGGELLVGADGDVLQLDWLWPRTR